ncbi:pilus assembly protein PilM [Ruminococcus sp. Marseille-P6503]|uniref:pilus assembly protein PilM n=1 Tax=Ruminococcus sp. Marseille-P6503 TaxID=2364796 RepID=UPI000F54771D|nr:pilus assembly protein PilM [Ruminococcus sp. Marseille-P6503]
MLSFDISDRQINIVMGDNSANKIRIEKSLTVDVPEDMIINGEVINLSGLAELLTTNLKSELMDDKDAIVTFSSSNIVFKELVVPKAKGNEFLTMVQNHMSQEMGITDEYSISYTIVGEAGEENPGALKVLATACPSSIVEAFRKLFNIMSLNLKSVNISCNSISRIVLADKSNIEKMPLLVCQLDNNFLGLTLFENGQMAFARYVPISPEDYETEDYLIEALNENIFRMEQFNKARGGPGLDNVILYGQIDDYIKLVDALDELDIKASILGVPAQITGYENFEFTVFANAIGALYRRNKQTERINLLEVDSSTGKSSAGVSSLLVTAGVIICASAIAIAAITLFIGIREDGIRDDIAAVENDISQCDEIIEGNKVYHAYLTMAESYKTMVENAKSNLSSLPVLKKQVFDQIDSATGSEIEYEGFTYDETQGLVTISNVKLTEQLEAPEFVRAIKNLNYFADVQFSGYTGTGESDDPVIITSLQLYMKGQGEE